MTPSRAKDLGMTLLKSLNVLHAFTPNPLRASLKPHIHPQYLTSAIRMASENPSIRSHDGLKASSLFSVSGFTAVVIGGGIGIGLVVIEALVVNSAHVYITGRRQEGLEQRRPAILYRPWQDHRAS